MITGCFTVCVLSGMFALLIYEGALADQTLLWIAVGANKHNRINNSVYHINQKGETTMNTCSTPNLYRVVLAHSLASAGFAVYSIVFASNPIAAAFGSSGNFTPNESSWWKAGKFFAADVLHQTGIWRMDVILMDMTNGRRLILSRNLPVAD